MCLMFWEGTAAHPSRAPVGRRALRHADSSYKTG